MAREFNPSVSSGVEDRPRDISGRPLRWTGLVTALAAALPALAQQTPDAGQLLQQQERQLPRPPRSSSGVDIRPSAQAPTLPGGQRVVLQSVSLRGVSVFREADLLAVLGPVAGQSYDMAGLRGLLARISTHYRDRGYPFTRAFLPPQPLTDGQLVIEVVEGRYGKVEARGEMAQAAQRFLAPLRPGAVIESGALERATLLLADQPGLRVAPIIRPGQAAGTGDLDVQVSRDRRLRADAGMDNHGNRYTGEYRARLSIQADSPFLPGDQVQLRGLLSDGAMGLGSLGYSLPLGSSGWRGNAGYSHTQYELGEQFANLDATGTAKTRTVGLSYPLLRSQRANLTLGASWQHKRLKDRQGAAGTENRKRSESLPLSLQFDLRDGLAGGGISFGTLSWTQGRLSLDDNLKAADAATARSNGGFHKWNLDVARLQTLPEAWVVYARVSAQWARNNLDSSDGFGLGGASGVRAYPQGEAYGDEGWLAQLELRYGLGAVTPFVFHDAGRVRINHRPWDNSVNHRSISGSGLGVRMQHEGWSADASVAWRHRGGDAQSDTRQRNPMLWLAAGYQF